MLMPTLEDIVGAIVSGLLMGSIYSLIAMGLALIWGVMNVINFAQAEFMTLAAFLTFFLWTLFKVDPLLALPIIFAVIFALGYAIEQGIIKRVLGAPPLNQIFLTFALLLVMRYGMMVGFGPFTRILSGVPYAEITLRYGPVAVPLPKLIGLIISISTALLLYLFLTRTYTGIAIRAAAQNSQAAQLMGVDIHKIYGIAFALGVAISGIGGVILALFFPIYAEMGAYFCVLAFIIVVFGGFSSIFGAYIAGLIIGISETVSALFINPSLKTLAAFAIFIITLLIKPTGLFGKG